MIGVQFETPAPAEKRPPEYLVKSTFLPGDGSMFATCSGAFRSRAIAEEAACRMLFDPRVICAEIIEQ